MRRSYGQSCPLALATELLGGRWTLLVLSRFLLGCTRFADVQRSLPQMSPSLLSRRLKELAEAGLIARVAAGDEAGSYRLTEAGRELGPVIEQLTLWGRHWARDVVHEDLDPAFLAWSLHLLADPSAFPGESTVIELTFTGSPTACDRFWLVKSGDEVEMCLKDPGLDVDLAVRADLERFVDAWRGFRDLGEEIRSGRIEVHGPEPLVAGLPRFLRGSSHSGHRRRRDGRERRLEARRYGAGAG